jgi:hypothetical protein
MSFYTCFDWFKKLRLFVNVLNLKNRRCSQGVACSCHRVIFFKGIQAVRIDFFLFILKVANIRCLILIKCSEQEARFKKYTIMS